MYVFRSCWSIHAFGRVSTMAPEGWGECTCTVFFFPLKIILREGIRPSTITVSMTVIHLLSALVVHTIISLMYFNSINCLVWYRIKIHGGFSHVSDQAQWIFISLLIVLCLPEQARMRTWPLTVQEVLMTLMS